MNIGKLHETQKNFPQAIDYLKKSLSIYESLDDKKNTAYCLNNIGSILSNMKQYKEALENFKKALKILEKSKDKKAVSTCLVNIGATLVNCNKQDESFGYFQKALVISALIGDNNSQAFSLINIGAYYNLKKEYSKGIEYCSRGLDVAKSIKNIELQNNALEVLFELYSKQGDYKNAFIYHVQYKRINDSIYNAEKTKQITEVEAKYQNEKKQKEIELLNKDKELQKIEVRSQKFQKYAFIGGFVLMLLLAVVILRSYREKRKANILLENQKKEIEKQKEHIENIHEDLTDSIRYAERIQNAVLPREQYIKEKIQGEFFILFKPRDIVSGDFYFVEKRKNWLLVTVADCTGHGVPGAFMSMLGISFLNEIIAKDEIQSASHVLNELRQYVIHSLQQKGIEGEQQDGMDIAFIALNTETSMLEYSGANNPLYIIPAEKNEITEIKADKMPVGIYQEMHPFKNNIIKINKGDRLYIFSDGYIDQFGGENHRKFLPKRFKESLLQIAHLHMHEQKETLDKIIENWKGENDQIDDITVMGIKI
ncbi:MAG: SpoIIE family protein phosphatase [Bacteroidia bacterium]|nr:SpoIIE family protein phosphatase [Bacteroidia bacterium]